MKRYLTLLVLLLGTTACSLNPHPSPKSTMNPANAEATTAAFVLTRSAKTAMPTITKEPAYFVMLVCSECTAQGGDVDIWEFAGSAQGRVLASVSDGAVVQVLDTITADDGSTWYKVMTNGIEGWVSKDFVKDIEV